MPDEQVLLPAVLPGTNGAVDQLTQALGVPRDMLPSSAQIEAAWSMLPRLISEIPLAYRTEHHARMCIAVSVGLFDGAINYAWNAVILRLRERVRSFGLTVVQQMVGRSFDEQSLVELRDADLLKLCLELNLLSQDGYFFLDQCRDVRNNFSSAHPAMGVIDDIEFAAFVNRCTRYAFADQADPRGIDSQAFIGALKGSRFTSDQTNEWAERMRRTHDAQRALLLRTIHGLYCDPQSGQDTRLNALDVAQVISAELSDAIISQVIDQHSEYVARGESDRQTASREFFERIGRLSGLLNDHEKHTLISTASKRLLAVHQAIDNFHNEPAYAERLLELTKQVSVPASAQEEFVDTVLTCAVGNQYGVSWVASPTYKAIIRNFSPREVRLMLHAPQRATILAQRLRDFPKCRERFGQLVALIDAGSISPADQPTYQRWLPA